MFSVFLSRKGKFSFSCSYGSQQNPEITISDGALTAYIGIGINLILLRNLKTSEEVFWISNPALEIFHCFENGFQIN